MTRRVAFISEHASPVALLGGQDAGGQNVYIDRLSRGLAALGWPVDVFTRRDDADAPEVIDWAPSVRVVNLPVGPARIVPKDELWPLMPAFREAMWAFIARDGADYALLHGNFWMSGWVAVEVGARLERPVVQIFHATGVTKRREQGDADTSPAGRIAVERDVVRRADRIIAQCPAERDELLADYAAEAAKIALIPSGIDADLFAPVDRVEARRAIGLPDDRPVIVYVGRMLPRKDVRNVVRALALLRDQIDGGHLPGPAPRLLLVGGETRDPDPAQTPEIGELQRLASLLGVRELVRFAGRRQPRELKHYYGAGDIAVTTPWYEPFGLTPLEGMACGRPVVGSAVGGIAFTIAAGETGLLVPPRDPEALATAFATLLADPSMRERMGRAARARVLAEFTWPLVAERTAHLYDALLTERALMRVPAAAGASWEGAFA
ncbi:MAG TPA: glycosyltransferase [Thermomicrobiales bacterium]|nr:glycosyltransferase [Thermomicrobiales bacterium]